MISGIAFRALAESFLARRPFPNQDSLLATLCSLRIGMSRGAAIRAERSWSTASGLSQTTTFAFEGSINRYYDPTTGQFLSVDPLVGITVQAYAYSGDDPVNMTDPLGLWGWNPISDVVQAATDVGHDVAAGANWVAHHPLQIAAIVGGAVVIVGATVLTGGLVDVLVATASGLVEEESTIGGLEAVELAIHAPFILAPGITLGALGAGSLGWGIYSLVADSSGARQACQ